MMLKEKAKLITMTSPPRYRRSRKSEILFWNQYPAHLWNLKVLKDRRWLKHQNRLL